jgi:hypothetical protein
MSLPDYLRLSHGTPVVWGEAGASGVTRTLSFDALAAGSARMGAKVDLGEHWDADYLVVLIVESGTAPTAGGTVDLYFAQSHDNSTWPAGVTGSDGAWPSDGNQDEWAKQLGLPVAQLVATNDGNTTQVQNAVLFRPLSRYLAPVVDNNLDQAIRDHTTASNNASRVVLLPIRTSIEDSAS